jgi:2-oxoglutarate ferredoxin oxidoreductase subunit alpha
MEISRVRFDMGNAAIAEGAIDAGARFFAGYPITPSTEIAEYASKMLPAVGGHYIQMEDELGSMAAIIGASAVGVKSFTATSGPGFTLMQENFGAAVVYELPVVLVDIQRAGPSTGLATKALQGDVMMAKWGTPGDDEVIVISPASVQECYDFTIDAFNLAEKYRTPVILLADKMIGHLRERYVTRPPEERSIINRRYPDCAPEDYKTFDFGKFDDEVAPLAPFGDPVYRTRINTSGHNEKGVPNGTYENTIKFNRHYVNKILKNMDDIVRTKSFGMDDAEYVIISFGCSVRSALGAMEIGRVNGLKIGVLQLITVWPFPDKLIAQVCAKAKAVFVPEMNQGMIVREVKRAADCATPIISVNRIDTEMVTPGQILKALEEVQK